MEFIVEEIEVKTDHDTEHDSDTHGYPILKNEDWKSMSPNRDMDENEETFDPYFKLKLMVDELLTIFTKHGEKCGICVEYIVNLCQHIGQTHESSHECSEHNNTPSNSSNFLKQPPNSESRCIPIQITKSEDASTSLNGPTTITGINTLGERNYPSRNIGLPGEDNDDENGGDNQSGKSCISPPNTPSTVNKSKKAHGNNRGLSRNILSQTSCELCGKDFAHKYRLERHLLTHTGEKPFECDICRKCFTRDSTLRDHKRIHTGEMPYKCNICSSVFRYSSGLRAHKRLVKCKRTKSNYNRRVVTKSQKRSTCAKVFQSKSGLKAHRAVHTGENRFYCGVCGQGFFYNYLLVRHKSTHTGEKQFHCRVCGKCFPYNCLLVKHRRSHMRERKFNCNLCGKSYFYKYGLDKHRLTHTGEKQLKSFQTLSILKARKIQSDSQKEKSQVKHSIKSPQLVTVKIKHTQVKTQMPDV